MDIDWEGAEICYYYNGESHALGLSDIQFAIILKLLGIQINEDGSINCFTDETLKKFMSMKSNPLAFKINKTD